MLTHLTCWLCGREYDWQALSTLCECGKPLRAEYELPALPREALRDREPTMWRYREMLPPCEPVSLGEGMTPLHHVPHFGENWYIKDESVNPTASFKARGMSAAVSMAKHLGAQRLAAPSAGNAGGALAAYAAKAGLRADVFLPADTPMPCVEECRAHGAEVHLIDGLISDCAAEMRSRSENWFDMSTLREPYRVEGKKTMGYELAEQMDWRLPDVIVYPAGGGTGLVGMWKAFDEMERMGWIGPERPRMVAVQASGCCPIVAAFDRGERFAEEHVGARTVAAGLRVPKAIGDFIMLDILRASGGTAVAVSDGDMVLAAREIASTAGAFACPEGGATLAAARRLLDAGFMVDSDTVVLFNTGSGLKYLETIRLGELQQHEQGCCNCLCSPFLRTTGRSRHGTTNEP